MAGEITRGKITRGDLANWDGRNATVSRPDSNGGTTTGYAIGNSVDILSVFGPLIGRTDATLSIALAHLGSAVCTISFAPGTWAIENSVTVPSNITCHIPAGVIFDVSSAKTLTFSGRTIVEYPEQWTSGAGTVSVSNMAAWHAITAAETAAGVTPTNYAYLPGDVRRYGAVGDGVTNDTAALSAAISVIQEGETSRTPADASKFDYGPALFIPGGFRMLTTGGHSFPRIVKSDGYASIYCSSAVTDVFTGADIYSCYWNGIIIEGGKSQIVIDNENLNAGEWIFDDCEFFKSADYAIKALNTSISYDVTSTVLRLINCRIRSCNKHLHTQCDLSYIHGGWQQPQQSLFDDNSAAIRNEGFLSIDSVVFVPFASGSAAPVRRRWIDNYGGISAANCMFGAENGGIPIVYHFAEPVEFNALSANRVQAGIAFDRCFLGCGADAQSDSGVINVRGELPMRVAITNCVGSISGKGLIVNETSGGGIADLATYISDYETATANTAKLQFFYHYAGNNFTRSNNERLWPSELDLYTTLPRPAKAYVAKATSTTSQTAETGATTIVTYDTATHDPWSLVDLGTTDGVRAPEYATFARISGFVEVSSHSANNLIYNLRLYNGSTPIQDAYTNYLHEITGIIRIQVSGEVPVTYNDLVNMRFVQSSGGSLTIARSALTVEFL